MINIPYSQLNTSSREAVDRLVSIGIKVRVNKIGAFPFQEFECRARYGDIYDPIVRYGEDPQTAIFKLHRAVHLVWKELLMVKDC
jgi:hypothetical protein